MTDALLATTVAAELLLGGCLVVSLASPRHRIWPPPGRDSWQFRLVWTLTLVSCAGIILVGVLDWNHGPLDGWLRLPVGAAFVASGLSLALWGVRTLGAHRTLGLKQTLVRSGPYRFTRNPQYVGDIALLLGWAILCNSSFTWLVSALAAAWFAVAPWAEEPWLRAQYGEPYDAYRRSLPRYLGRPRSQAPPPPA